MISVKGPLNVGTSQGYGVDSRVGRLVWIFILLHVFLVQEFVRKSFYQGCFGPFGGDLDNHAAMKSLPSTQLQDKTSKTC